MLCSWTPLPVCLFVCLISLFVYFCDCWSLGVSPVYHLFTTGLSLVYHLFITGETSRSQAHPRIPCQAHLAKGRAAKMPNRLNPEQTKASTNEAQPTHSPSSKQQGKSRVLRIVSHMARLKSGFLFKATVMNYLVYDSHGSFSRSLLACQCQSTIDRTTKMSDVCQWPPYVNIGSCIVCVWRTLSHPPSRFPRLSAVWFPPQLGSWTYRFHARERVQTCAWLDGSLLIASST